jgi:hypothetical protein
MENFDDCWEILLVFDLQQRRPSEPPLCRYRWPIAAWRSIVWLGAAARSRRPQRHRWARGAWAIGRAFADVQVQLAQPMRLTGLTLSPFPATPRNLPPEINRDHSRLNTHCLHESRLAPVRFHYCDFVRRFSAPLFT